jgi:hypothetical protein
MSSAVTSPAVAFGSDDAGGSDEAGGSDDAGGLDDVGGLSPLGADGAGSKVAVSGVGTYAPRPHVPWCLWWG